MTRRGCSARPMPRCTRSSGVRRTAWRGGGERPRTGEARSATRSGRAGSAHRLLPLLQRLQLEGVAPRPEEAEPHPRLVEVVRRRTRVARALDAHHRHLQLGPGLRQLERARDAPLPLLHARDADAVVVGQVGLLRLQRRERAPELRVAPPQAGERVEHRPRRRRRAEVERAAVQVIAQVVKIEHPRHGDPIRGLITGGMIPGATGRNFIVEQLGRQKRSVGIDLGTDDGRALLYRLVERADVFLTNFLPDARERLRITYEDLRRVNPRLVYAKGHGQGARGPDARRGGYDGVSFWARGGIADRLSTPGGPYVQQRPAFGDFIGGMCIAGGVAAALFRREKTGQGIELDVSLLGTAAEPARAAPGPAGGGQRLPARVARARGDGARVREPGPVRGRAAGRPARRAGRRGADRGGAARARLHLEEIARWKESGVVA